MPSHFNCKLSPTCLLASATLTASLFLSACGGGSSNPTATQSDTSPPVVLAPAAISIDVASGAIGVAADDSRVAGLLNGVRASDNVGVIGAITNDAPAWFPVGDTKITFTAKDAAGNIGKSSSVVTVTYSNDQGILLAGNLWGPGNSATPAGTFRYTSIGPILRHSDGSYYVVDGNAIRHISAAGTGTQYGIFVGSILESGCNDGSGTTARSKGILSITEDKNGTIFFVDACKTIRKVTADGVVSTLAGSADSAAYVDGTGSAARFFNPFGIAIDANNNLYVTETGGHLSDPFPSQNSTPLPGSTIRKISPSGVVTTFVGQSGKYDTVDGTAATAIFNSPKNIAMNSEGSLVVTEQTGYALRKISPAGLVTTLTSTPSAVSAVTFDSNGNLYLANFQGVSKLNTSGILTNVYTSDFTTTNGIVVDLNNRVLIAHNDLAETGVVDLINAQGGLTRFSGLARFDGHANGVGSMARFNRPASTAVDKAGNVFVLDSLNFVIRKITPDGIVSDFAGQANMRGTDDGTGTAARFWSLAQVAIDANDNLYVTGYNPQNGGTLRMITPSGVVSTLYGNDPSIQYVFWNITSDSLGSIYTGTLVLDNRQGPGVFNGYTIYRISPTGLVPQSIAVGLNEKLTASFAFDSHGNLYLADQVAITKITPSGASSVFVGNPSMSGHQDGIGTAATFFSIGELVFDANDNLYVTDPQEGIIRKITPAAVVTTYAGTVGAYGNTFPPSSSSLYQPHGISIGKNGMIVISSNAILQIKPH